METYISSLRPACQAAFAPLRFELQKLRYLRMAFKRGGLQGVAIPSACEVPETPSITISTTSRADEAGDMGRISHKETMGTWKMS
jgi:hypothetical protein